MTKTKKTSKTRRIAGTLVGLIIMLTPITLFGTQAIAQRSLSAFQLPFCSPIDQNVALGIVIAGFAAGGFIMFWTRWEPDLGPLNDEERDVWHSWQEWKIKQLLPEKRKNYQHRKEFIPMTKTWKQNAMKIARTRGWNFEPEFIDDVLLK